jgi:hypothetical protein
VKIPLPNLDDRRWADLVDEGRSLIPLYAPDWTDHNVHDPGITLMELFAWLAEMDIYQLNRITDEHRLKFLALAGISPKSPHPSRTVLSISLKEGAPSFRLPASTEFAGNDVFGTETLFQTLDPISLAPGALQAVQIKDAKGFRNYTDSFDRELPFGVFGAIPEPGAELYLGLSEAPQRKIPLSLYFRFAGPRSGDDERELIIEEAKAQRRACRPCASEICCDHKKASASKVVEEAEEVPPFHWGRITWEFLAEDETGKRWLPLDPKKRQVIDHTRAFTLDGSVILKVRAPMIKKSVGRVDTPLYYFRCRFEAGAYDAPPIIQTIVFNGVRAEQATTVPMKFEINRNATIEGNEPAPGDRVGLLLQLDEQGKITRLVFVADESGPQFRVLAYEAPSTEPGSLTIDAALVGTGNGQPNQEIKLHIAPVVTESFRLFTLEEDEWRAWELKNDFDAALRGSSRFTLDPTRGIVKFGDGNRGRVPPGGSLIFAAYQSTRAESGNVEARTINRLNDSPHNRALLNDFDEIETGLKKITNPVAAAGGRAAESVDEAEGRAIELMNSTVRAVTLKDYEELAMRTPGTRLARVTARANIHPSFPCLQAPGMIMLIILPDMPVARPTPSPGLLRAVARYLDRRRVIGTRVDVVGPSYLEIAVHARVKALSGASKTTLQRKIADALNEFLDPLKGGPDGTGWPFGRDVYRSEIMQVIDEVVGVDHVFSLDLIAEGCDPQCGNVCLGPTSLVAVGQHEIEVI